MTPYILVLAVPTAACLFAIATRERRAGWRSLLPVFVLYLLFVGWRYQVGTDWFSYQRLHREALGRTFYETITAAEPFSYGLFWVAAHYDYGMPFSNAVAALILLTGVFAFAARTPNPHLAIAVAFPFLVVVTGMSAVRQSMAIGVLFLLFAIWKQTSLTTRLVMIGLAAMFHVSALGLVVLAVPRSALAGPYARVVEWWQRWRAGRRSRRRQALGRHGSRYAAPRARHRSAEAHSRRRSASTGHQRRRSTRRRAKLLQRPALVVSENRRSASAGHAAPRRRRRSRQAWTRPVRARPIVVWGQRLALAMFAALVIYHLFNYHETYADQFENYQKIYVAVDGLERSTSPGALMHISLVLAPALFLLAQRNRLKKYLPLQDIMWPGALLSLLSLPLLLYSSTGASRMIVYFYFVPMMVCPTVVLAYARFRLARSLIAAAIVAAHFGILVVWLLYANNATNYLPYRNLLLVGAR